MMNQNFSIGGFFQIKAVSADGKSTRMLADWFPNLITNIGLDRLGSLSACASHCRVGSSNTAPAFTDTQLFAQVAFTNSVTGNVGSASGSAPYYRSVQITYTFPAAPANQNLSEIGVGWADTGSTLFSRALTANGGGVPTTITVLTGEILIVTYEFRVYAPTVDFTGSLTIGGVITAIVARASNVTSGGVGSNGSPGNGFVGAYSENVTNPANYSAFSGDAVLGAVTGQPTATNAGPNGGNTVSQTAYVPGTYYIDTVILSALGDTNFVGGIGAVKFNNNFGQFQVSFTPPIAKTVSDTLTATYRVSWVRR